MEETEPLERRIDRSDGIHRSSKVLDIAIRFRGISVIDHDRVTRGGGGELRVDPRPRGPAWDESAEIREQEGWEEHAAFMDGLVEDGFLLLGGPVGDHRQTLHVVEAAEEDDVRSRLAADPWARRRLLEIGSIRPWALWLDFRRSRDADGGIGKS